jgi:septum formation protein
LQSSFFKPNNQKGLEIRHYAICICRRLGQGISFVAAWAEKYKGISKINQTQFPNPDDYVKATATEKALDVYKRIVKDPTAKRKHIIIGSDTIVVLDNQILEKPLDKDHAHSMLRDLSGKKHQVITALCILFNHNGKQVVRAHVEKTAVEFSTLSQKLIEAYVASGEPMWEFTYDLLVSLSPKTHQWLSSMRIGTRPEDMDIKD